MDLTNKEIFLRNESRENDCSLPLDDPAVLSRPHICGFFNNHEDEFRVTIPFILDGLKKGEKAFHTVDPARRTEHLQQLKSAGIDTNATQESCQLEVHDWTEVHLRGGLFDMSRTLAGWEQIALEVSNTSQLRDLATSSSRIFGWNTKAGSQTQSNQVVISQEQLREIGMLRDKIAPEESEEVSRKLSEMTPEEMEKFGRNARELLARDRNMEQPKLPRRHLPPKFTK